MFEESIHRARPDLALFVLASLQPLIRKAKAKKQKKKYERFYVHDQPFCKLKNRDGTTVADLVLYHQSDERELYYRLYSTLE